MFNTRLQGTRDRALVGRAFGEVWQRHTLSTATELITTWCTRGNPSNFLRTVVGRGIQLENGPFVRAVSTARFTAISITTCFVEDSGHG